MQTNDAVTEEKIAKIIERIENLTRRAEHPNTPMPERELCLEQIEKLVTRYSISEASISADNTESFERQIFIYDFSLTDNYLPERFQLLTAIAKPLGVKVIFNRRLSSAWKQVMSNTGNLLGTGDRNIVAWKLYDSIDDHMESVRYKRAGTGARAQRSFMMGYTAEVSRRAADHYREVVSEMDENTVKSAELVLVSDKERIDAYIDAEMNLKNSKGKRDVSIDPDSYFSGVDAGKEANITLASNEVDAAKNAMQLSS